jgi:TIR domain
MSDIFISYSKADHALALKLSAFLEAEGWSVWWDKGLGAADLYRDEIMKQLAAARAVITIWTENSVKSDWVRAEAGRAKAEGKLIPIKTPDVAYADIPLPFGEMHTENVGSTDLIRAAIVAQLAKPSVSQSPFRQITSTFKYQVLTWVGIVGSALTLFANLNGVLDMADWARELVDHWRDWSQVFWGWAFSLFRFKVPKEVTPVISFAVFAMVLVVGVNLSYRRATKKSGRTHSAMPIKRKLWVFIGGVVVIFIWDVLVFTKVLVTYLGVPPSDTLLFILLPRCLMMTYLLLTVKERRWVLVASLLLIGMGEVLLMIPLHLGLADERDLSFPLLLSDSALFEVCWLAVILFTPLQQLTNRLAFVVLGVLLLIGLSEISKLNLHQYLQPTKVSENSVR